MKKRIAVLFLALVLAASSSTTALAAEASPFTDLHPEHWAYPYVSALHQSGVVGGYPDGTFQGENDVTWGEVFKLLLLAVGVEEPERDPEKHWAYPYIQLALDNRLVYAFLEEYLDAAPARLDVARMAARALDLTDISGESPYTDCADGYVVELFEKGIMNGTVEADGLRYFYPDRPISRQELVTMLSRYETEYLGRAIRPSGSLARFSDGAGVHTAARDAMLHTMACKASIKGGWKSDPAELQALVDRVQSGEVQFCPHGRPVKVRVSKYEIEKMFKRA